MVVYAIEQGVTKPGDRMAPCFGWFYRTDYYRHVGWSPRSRHLGRSLGSTAPQSPRH